jgi:shikimate kinase
VKRFLVLVGLPGSGKSTVGRLLARIMDARFFDVDEEIERREGMSVAEIISGRGEKEFRRLEKLETDRALAGAPGVVVPGGGWAAEGDNLEMARDRAFTIYLETTAQTAAMRVGTISGRPLLDGADPLSRMIDLLALRRSFYENCHATVTTDGKTAPEVAAEIVKLARRAAAG